MEEENKENDIQFKNLDDDGFEVINGKNINNFSPETNNKLLDEYDNYANTQMSHSFMIQLEKGSK